ncbi:MAG: ABC transporter ATP-binding protein, partial [Bacillota bacterium]
TERRLREIEHEIEIYRREGLVEKLREAILLSQDEERLKRMKSSVEQAFSLWSASKERLQSQLMQGLILAGQAESVNKAILQKAADEITGLRDRLMGLVSEGEEHFRTAISALSALAVRWGQERQTVDEVIERVKQELGVHRLDPERLDELVREQTRLRGRLQEVEAFERDKEAKLRIRRGLLRQYRDIRHDIFELRRSEAEEITKKIGGSVKVRVDYKGQTEAFVDRLVSFFQGSGVDRKTLEGICHREGRNVDGQAIAEAAEKGAAELEKQFGLTPARANQVASWLNAQPERLFELQLLSPDDRVDILMTVDGSDLPLEWLSGGQRATAMLLLILAQADRLLIIDQPEDDLDNRFIYEDIVKILRGAKAKRQIVVATHNPNIPVLGDAELIVAMDVREGKAGILAQGAVDLLEVRDAVKRIMEGGEDAFRRRAEKYGWYIEDRPT